MKYRNSNQVSSESTKLRKFLEEVRDASNKLASINASNANGIIAFESNSADAKHELNNSFDALSQSVMDAFAEMLPQRKVVSTEAGNFVQEEMYVRETLVEAGTIAGFLSGNPKRLFEATKKALGKSMASTESYAVVTPYADDVVTERSASLEAYDETDSRNASMYSIVYNTISARQDEFNETLFPTLVVSPEQPGIEIAVKLMTVFDAIDRKVTGVFEDFNRKNIIRAYADSTVLRKDQTTITPVWRAQAAAQFVDNATIAHAPVTIDGEAIETAPLKFGVTSDLLALSQTDTLIASGTMNQTDSIDPAVTLKNIYFSATDGIDVDILKIETLNIPRSNFTYNPQDNSRTAILNFTTSSIVLKKGQKQYNGAALVALAVIDSSDLIVRLDLTITGELNLETGKLSVYSNKIAVNATYDAAGAPIAMGSAPQSGIVTKIGLAVPLGYELRAYRVNSNRRQIGQLINIMDYRQMYRVPLRSPISAQRSMSSDDSLDTSDIQALIATTHVRLQNEGVAALVAASTTLKSYVDVRDSAGNGPDVLGVGRFYVRASYQAESISIPALVNSITSAERAADIQAALIQKIRNMALKMYVESEYQAAANVLAGGIAPTPTIIVATDPIIANYLTSPGDLRTFGPEFNYRIVSSLNTQIRGKIFVTFGVFDESRNSMVNPLNFGNMLWGSEVVISANISRNGATSKELMVQPRYAFIVNLPVLAEITVTNLDLAVEKQAIDFKDVT